MAKRLPEEDFRLAVAWLRSNEGPDGEAESCARVADWIESMLSERAFRSTTKGTTPEFRRLVRRKMNELKESQS